MALIVEDGSIVANANTFATEVELEAYAEGIGATVSGNIESALIVAGEFIASHEPRLRGARVAKTQPMPWPRSGAVIEGFEWSADEIPRQVILAQMALAIEVLNGVDLYNPPSNPTRTRKREKIDGAIEVEYFGTDDAVKMSRWSRAQALMAGLMTAAGLTLVRA